MTETGIRSYGPGKFNTMLDAYVYSVSLEGSTDDEISSEYSGTWYGLIRHGHTIWSDQDPDREALTEAEADYLRACAGAILTEDTQGFVYVEYFDNMTDLDNMWRDLQTQYASQYDDDQQGEV